MTTTTTTTPATTPTTTITTITATGATTGKVLIADHGFADSKRRAIGGYATVEDRYDDVKDESGTWRRVRVEGQLVVRTYATRAGAQFGAAFPRGTVVTGGAEAALALARRKLIEQGNRYRKNPPR